MRSGVLNRGLALLVPALIGAASGLAGAAYFGRAGGATAQSPASSTTVVTRIVPIEQNQEAMQQIGELRAMLEARQDAGREQRPTGSALPAVEERGGRSAEENAAYHLDAHRAAIAEHQRQPRDPRWASAAESAFRRDLTALQDLGADDVTVDCRMTTCTAELQWPSFHDAQEKYTNVLHAEMSMNCGREILLPQPEDATQPYRATAVFRCERARAEQP
jgi:hypothetical protein